MLFQSRNLIPWITGALAIGGLVAMSMMDVPDDRLVINPVSSPVAAPPPQPEQASEGASEREVEYCADGATRSYSDRSCEPHQQLQLIPFSISPPPSAPR